MPSAFLARHARKILVLIVVAMLALGGLVYLHQQGITFGEVFKKLQDMAQWAAEKNPAYYVAAIALLPYVGVPSSFLYLAGGVYGKTAGILWTLLGLALNLPIGYFVGKYWLRTPIARLLEKNGHKLAEVPPGEFGKLIVLMRVIPGPPLVIQNFLLAMAGVPFWQYYVISLPLAMLFAIGILLTGGALLHGETGLVVAGVCAVVAVALLARIVQTWHQAQKKKK